MTSLLGKLGSAVAIAGLAVTVSACGSTDLEVKKSSVGDDVRGKPIRRQPGGKESLLGGGDLLSVGGDDKSSGGADLPVNKYLWRATLDTLAFLPLVSTDPYGGVIVTDWGSTAEDPNARFKVTSYITSAELKPQSLRVVVNRQTRTDAGQWVAAPVSPDTPRKIENAILTRARLIKSGETPTQ